MKDIICFVSIGEGLLHACISSSLLTDQEILLFLLVSKINQANTKLVFLFKVLLTQDAVFTPWNLCMYPSFTVKEFFDFTKIKKFLSRLNLNIF